MRFGPAFQKNCQIIIVLLVGVLGLLLNAPELRGQPRVLQVQGGAQRAQEGPAIPAATPPAFVTVSDGTPLTLKIQKEISSATATVGDTVEFTTLYPLRIDGLVVLPAGTSVSGTVVQISHPHRPSKSGRVSMVVGKVVLPSGEVAALRPSKSASGKGVSLEGRRESGDLKPINWAFAPLDPLTAAIVLPIALSTKGHEMVYAAGTRTKVYFDGPLNLNRDALEKLQPAPYIGPAQVFFGYHQWGDGTYTQLYCSGKLVESDFTTLLLDLNPGTYLFSTDAKGKHAVQIQVQENHQYLIEREHRGLFVKDPQEHLNEMDEIDNDPSVRKSNFTPPFMDGFCPQMAQP